MTAPTRQTERDIQSQILLHIARGEVRLFRLNTGVGWTGEVIARSANTITLRNPRPLHSGMVTGGSDLIGWRSITITPNIVGQRVAVFSAIEVKSATGRVSNEQQAFIDAVNDAGGYAGVARSIEDAGKVLYVEP